MSKTISNDEWCEYQFLKFYHGAVQDCLGPADWDINKSIEDAFVRQHGEEALPEDILRERLERAELRRLEAVRREEEARR